MPGLVTEGRSQPQRFTPKLRHALLTIATVSLVFSPIDALAQATTDSTRIAELERQIEAVSRELERLDLGADVVQADSSAYGFGPAASKVYQIESGVSIGGYGEFLYENYSTERENGQASGALDKHDALRAIIYLGYKFNDRFIFNSEIEIEHAKEIYLEFAYLDYNLSDNFGLRGGMLLAPLGLVNELHEPPIFLGSERAITEQRIIPTTWRENGFGAFGGSDTFSWRLYAMNSLNGANFGAKGVRGGRQKGYKALAEDFGIAGRLDYTGTPGLLVGLSAYTGGTAHNREIDGRKVDGRLTIWDAHLDYRTGGFWLRGLIASATIGDAARLNSLAGNAGDDGVGEEMGGWYVQAGYDILRNTTASHELIPYIGFERVNTQQAVPMGFSIDPSMDLSLTTIGAAWRPLPQISLKMDYQIHSNEAGTGVNQWNVNLGWLF